MIQQGSICQQGWCSIKSTRRGKSWELDQMSIRPIRPSHSMSTFAPKNSVKTLVNLLSLDISTWIKTRVINSRPNNFGAQPPQIPKFTILTPSTTLLTGYSWVKETICSINFCTKRMIVRERLSQWIRIGGRARKEDINWRTRSLHLMSMRISWWSGASS